MAVPRNIKPMLARTSEPFDSGAHSFELKWDGTRCIAFIGKGTLRLQNRRLADITVRYPEFHFLARALPAGTVLDGEIVVLSGGRPSFRRLQEREQITDPDKIEMRSALLPATYVVFDLLYHGGRGLIDRPLRERRGLLEGLFPLNDSIILSESYSMGRELFSEAVGRGFEGVMAKAADSPYLPGVRSAHWLKIKKSADIDAVVCGYTEGHGKRSGTLGALVLCAYEGKRLRYMGRVGTGFDEAALASLIRTLKGLKASHKTVDEGEAEGLREVHWIRPELVARVGFLERTRSGRLRAPVFKGLRSDKPPKDCSFR